MLDEKNKLWKRVQQQDYGGARVSDELLTISQTAEYLKLSEKTVRRLIHSSQLISSKIGNRFWRIRTSDVDRYIQANTNGQKGVSEK